MATQRIERQGSASEHAAFTGAQGEVTYDSDLKVERSHDGSQVGGFLQHKAGQPTEVGGDTALSLSDFGGFVDVDTDTSSGDVTVTLPATGDMPAGWEVLLRKGAAANTLTIATDASETIDGGSTLVLTGLGEYAVIRFDGSNFLALGTIAGVLTADPEHATDGGTDAYASATNTTAPGDGVQIVRDFQSANTTTTPELDSNVITDRDGNALWSGAISGVHTLQYDGGADTYLLLYPIRKSEPTVQVFSSSDTWNRPAGCRRVVVEVLGAGGGGGGAANTNDTSAAAATGGSAGGYSVKTLDAASVSSSTIAIGAGGDGGATGDNPGSDGGNSSWDDGANTVSGNGGSGGTGSANNNGAGRASNAGGTASGGDVNANGMRASNSMMYSGANSLAMASPGANSQYGEGGSGGVESGGGATSGGSANGAGAGGGGASSNGSGGNGAAGGSGADGIVIVTEYY